MSAQLMKDKQQFPVQSKALEKKFTRVAIDISEDQESKLKKVN